MNINDNITQSQETPSVNKVLALLKPGEEAELHDEFAYLGYVDNDYDSDSDYDYDEDDYASSDSREFYNESENNFIGLAALFQWNCFYLYINLVYKESLPPKF